MKALESPASPGWTVEIPAAVLTEIEGLYERGLLLKAWKIAGSFGPLSRWAGPHAAVLAGRLAVHLGSARLARVIHWRNWKRHPYDYRAASYYLRDILERRGALRALEFIQAWPDSGGPVDAEGHLYWLTLHAEAAEAFRDFDTARQCLGEARRLYHGHPWLEVAEANLLSKQDRNEEALAAAQRSLEENSSFRPGIQLVAHLLSVLGRSEEALALLADADDRMESGSIASQRALLEMEFERWEEALRQFDRTFQLSPLADKPMLRWLNGNRVAVACCMGDLTRARAWVRDLADPYHRDLAARLDEPAPDLRRLRLPVGFVRQHHLTCAPATLSALSAYWRQPAEHLNIAERICFDGTPNHSERRWAETHGFAAREFTVTWEAAVALLDRGIPFTLTTLEATSGHLQAVIGYNALRRSLLLRDPYLYTTSEALCPQFIERYASSGPRGLALVPLAEQDRFAGLELPDAPFYDLLHQLFCALDEHRRDEAAQCLAQLEQSAPKHRLTLTAGRVLAAYDANSPQLRKYVEQLLELYPKDGHLLLAKAALMAEQENRLQRLHFLESVCALPQSDPILKVRLAAELRQDARELPRAVDLMRWALRYRPCDPELLATLGDLFWDQRALEKSVELYRLAACLADKTDRWARLYFSASRSVRETATALNFLEQRFREFGKQSAQPAITLFDALVALARGAEAFNVLEKALTLRPQDGDLLLFAADAQARFGEYAEADRYLRLAKGQCRRSLWLRSAATLWSYRAERRQALEAWQEILALEPLAIDANRSVAWLLCEMEGRPAGQRFLDEVCDRFPNHCGLLSLRIEFRRADGAAALEEPLRRLLAVNPADAWAHRELAFQLGQLNRLTEALTWCAEAIRIEPNSPHGFCTRGDLKLLSGDAAGAAADFKTALALAVDTGAAMQRLMDACQTQQQRRDALEFIEREIVRQVVEGESLQAFRILARGVLEPEAVLSRLEEARAARPDLWSAWSVVMHQLTDLNRLDEALAIAEQATRHFPFLPRLWLDRAWVHELRLERAQTVAALERALLLNPAFGEASRELAALHEKAGEFPLAQQTLDLACAHAPLDAMNHGCYASLLWKKGQKTEALERLQHALRLDPSYVWAWQVLATWSAELQDPEAAVRLARDLVQRRPGEALSWLRLAEALMESNETEALEVTERALALNPFAVDAHDLKARLLARQNRFEEAVAACRPDVLESIPPALAVRSAWIEAQRGRLAIAIQRLEATLAEHPTFFGGWQLLAEWHQLVGDLEKAGADADQMARLAPQNAMALGYAAELLLKQGDRAQARQRLERAHALDPSYGYAGLALFDLLVEENELGNAGQLLQTLKHHLGGPNVTAREAQWMARQGRLNEALELFASLCREPAQQPAPLFLAADSLDAAGSRSAVDKLIGQILAEANPNPFLGLLWISRRFARRRFGLPRALRALFSREDLGRNSLSYYLDSLGDQYNRARPPGEFLLAWRLRRHGRRLFQCHRELLWNDDLLWGKAGYLLASMENYAQVVHWLRDWLHRKGVEAWMLYNLALALQVTDRGEEALPVLQHALELRQDANSFASLAVLCAMEQALRGSASQAQALLANLDLGKLQPFEKILHDLLKALLAAENGPSENQPGLLQQLRADLKQIFAQSAPCHQHILVRKVYLRCLKRMAELPGLGSMRWWGWWNYRRFGWIALAVILPAVPVLIIRPPFGWILLVILWWLCRRG